MSKKDLIRRVWNECFNDSPEYTDMYFSRIYTDDDALLEVAEDGRPVSILQVHPYTMLFHGAEAQLGYICGAATARKYRGRGHGKIPASTSAPRLTPFGIIRRPRRISGRWRSTAAAVP